MRSYAYISFCLSVSLCASLPLNPPTATSPASLRVARQINSITIPIVARDSLEKRQFRNPDYMTSNRPSTSDSSSSSQAASSTSSTSDNTVSPSSDDDKSNDNTSSDTPKEKRKTASIWGHRYAGEEMQ
ncbi:hypothetical protein C8J56DRAFT_439256 [Mycena floridula]|nr:hypothetical protein C8J56DRAFT_439256 [Mycena floridula]